METAKQDAPRSIREILNANGYRDVPGTIYGHRRIYKIQDKPSLAGDTYIGEFTAHNVLTALGLGGTE